MYDMIYIFFFQKIILFSLCIIIFVRYEIMLGDNLFKFLKNVTVIMNSKRAVGHVNKMFILQHYVALKVSLGIQVAIRNTARYLGHISVFGKIKKVRHFG